MFRRLTLLAVLLAGNAATAAQQALPAPVLAALKANDLGPEALAVAALPLSHAAAPWLHRAGVPMQPGSTMKLVTAIVALDRLGTELRGFTELRSAAPLQEGTLQGELVLQGGADPDLGIPQFWQMLLELRQAGVLSVQGDLLIDRTLFNPPRPDLGLPPFDEQPDFPYNVVPDALQLAGNLLPLAISSESGQVEVSSVPPLPGLQFDTGALTLKDKPCKDWDDDWKPLQRVHEGAVTRVVLQGSFPPACSQRQALQVLDRTELAERLFRTLWEGLGGRWNGRAREAATPPGTRLLVRREGRRWGEVLRPMMKQSDNPWTRLLFLQLGARGALAPERPTAERAAAEVRGWLAQHRISDTGLVLDNGSGLSRSERITPLQLASMLRVAWSARYAADLQASLPVAGVDGTLRNRLKNSPATGWARLKTGYLNNVVALAGYVRDAHGWPWAVAMMVNAPRAVRGRPAMEALIDHIARQGLPAAGAVWPPDKEHP